MNMITTLKRQSGVALVVSLLILLILTMIGVSGMQTTGMQEKMASNTKDRSQAFQAAESGVRDAEGYLETIVTTGAFDGTGGLFPEAQAEPDLFDGTTWTNNAKSVQASTVAGSVDPPRYFIRQFATVSGIEGAMNMYGQYGDNKGIGDVTIFRITSRGVGATEDDDGVSTEVVLRSYYGRIF
jgi:type IV pilus assembly protein PilX